MTKRIFRAICITAITVFIAALTMIVGVLYNYFGAEQMESLHAQAEFVGHSVEKDGIDYLNSFESDNCRITWIDSDGNVLFDNMGNIDEMENHLERKEILSAIRTGSGESQRYSTTLMERQLYSAIRLKDDTIIRLSVSRHTWVSLIVSMMQSILFIIVLVILVSFFLAFRLARNITRPLNALDLDQLERQSSYVEISPLVERILSQKKQLKIQAKELEQKREEFESATKNMTEGVLLLNKNGRIISINETARHLFGIRSNCVGEDLLKLCQYNELKEALSVAQSGKHIEKNLMLGEGSYQMNASPVITSGKVSGIALLLLDVTEKEKTEQMRREFTANVSHELKTPLQSISGCAELLLTGLVRQEDTEKFYSQIYEESRRMIALVEDIIRLSHIDEGAYDMNREDVDLFEVARSTINSLQPIAEHLGIELELEGESAIVKGIPQLLSRIFYNLCENGIKYNHPGGKVILSIKSQQTGAIVSVTDNGIGIPEDQKTRIFERFYRVDKSHSKSVGGTGLGLSIVKNALKLHDADIHVDSKLHEGTRITIKFFS